MRYFLSKLIYKFSGVESVMTNRRLTPSDWEGFQVGDVIYVTAASYTRYEGEATISALAEYCGRPAVFITVEGKSWGVVEIDRISFKYRNA